MLIKMNCIIHNITVGFSSFFFNSIKRKIDIIKGIKMNNIVNDDFSFYIFILQ